METKYNGWKNRQTWNCALWIGNDEPLYRAAVEFMKTYTGRTPYKSFTEYAGIENSKTPDNIWWRSSDLDYSALNEMMKEFKESNQ